MLGAAPPAFVSTARAAPSRRLRPRDLALPAALALLAAVESAGVAQEVPDRLLATAAPALLALPLVARRRHPLLVCWCVALAFGLIAVTGAVDIDATAGCSLIPLLALGCAACHTERLRGVLVAAVGTATIGSLSTGLFADGLPRPGDLLFGVVFTAGAVALGRAVHGGALRRLRLAIELDAARGDRAAAEQAARQERRRLAHELHDLGSHHLVVATLHAAIAARAAAAAAAAADADRAAAERARAREAFGVVRASIAQTGAALSQLTGAAPTGASDGSTALTAALADAAALGARVQAPASAALAAVPEAVALTAARVLQEARTNAAKHAAGGAVAISLELDDRSLAIAVRNEAGRSSALAGNGLGLTGMRERVRLLGGTLHAGAGDAKRGAGDANRGAGDANRGADDANRGAGDAKRGADDAKRGVGDAKRGADDAGGGWVVRASLPLATPKPGRRWVPRRGVLGGWPAWAVLGCPAWAALACATLGAWDAFEALVVDDGARAAARVGAALVAAAAPALLWRRPTALTAVALGALALRAWSATSAPTSSPVVLLTGLAAYAVAREARTLRGAALGVVALAAGLAASVLLGIAPGSVPDLGFLPGLVLGAGVAGLLLRLGARDLSQLDAELTRARAAGAAARAEAVAAERRRLEQELIALTRRSIGELEHLVARADDQRDSARAATLAAIETTAAAALADLGRLAAVLRER